MHTDGRICELDRSSHKRELVYDFNTKKLCAITWSQHSLYDAAMQGNHLFNGSETLMAFKHLCICYRHYSAHLQDAA
jgi:hypothetical protein